MANTTTSMDLLIRSELWSSQLKEILLDDLDSMRWVDFITEFPDGTTFTIPSIGQASTQDIQENVPVTYEALDTGEFQFVIDQYFGSATYITQKALQDSFYGQRVLASFVGKQRRAIMEKLETDILKTPGPNGSQSGTKQDANDTNSINGYEHRYIGSGTNETISVIDFAKAKLSLKKSNVPMTQMIAIVDPTVGYEIETSTNFINFSSANARWDDIVERGLTTGMRFIKNIYGFDVYESNYLDDANETISGITTSQGKQNLFFSAEASVLPIMGAWRQMPKVDSEFNKDLQRDEYLTTARYGLKLYRPENMVCVLTDTDQV